MTGSEYRAERKRLGLSQDALADRIQVSRATITRLERMDRVPVRDEYALLGVGSVDRSPRVRPLPRTNYDGRDIIEETDPETGFVTRRLLGVD